MHIYKHISLYQIKMDQADLATIIEASSYHCNWTSMGVQKRKESWTRQ